MKIYLDTCSLQRPFDSKTQVRNRLEAEAVLAIIAVHEKGGFELISSEALLFETRRNPDPARQEFVLAVLRQAKHFVRVTDIVRERAQELSQHGLMPLDALHLASAERAFSNYFCTCDDKLSKKARPLCEPQLRIVSPIQLLEEIENDA